MRENCVDFYRAPICFGMALTVNKPAMPIYAAMMEQQKQTILKGPITFKVKRRRSGL